MGLGRLLKKLLIILAWGNQARGLGQELYPLVGFNCTHNDIKVQELSLLNEASCPNFKEIAVEKS